MKKSKKNKLSKKITRKHGGKKNNTSQVVTQMGGVVEAPAPASIGVVEGLNVASVIDSMKTFGNVVYKLKQAADSSRESAEQHLLTSQVGKEAAASMSTAALSLSNAYFGIPGETTGLYHSLVNAPDYIPNAPAPR